MGALKVKNENHILIKWNRERKKPFTMLQLASKLDICPATLFNWLASKTLPTEKQSDKIAKLTKNKITRKDFL